MTAFLIITFEPTEQLFPIMPIHRLNEKPTKLGDFADLTCDSDGKITKFINNGKINNLFTLKLFQLISTILENGMFILGVSLPKKM